MTRLGAGDGGWQLDAQEATVSLSFGMTDFQRNSLAGRAGVGSEGRWVRIDDAASLLGMARNSVYRWLETRSLPAHRVRRLPPFDLSEVEACVQAGGGEGNGRTEPRRGLRTSPRKERRNR